MTVAAHFPCELDEIGERSSGPTDDRGRACCPKRYCCVVSSAGGVEVRRRDDRQIDHVCCAETHKFVRWHVCSQVLNVPVVIPKSHCRHRRRQRMVITADCRNDCCPTPPAARVGCEFTEDSLHDGRCPVFDRDRQSAIMPRLTDVNERRNEHRLNDIYHRCPFVDEAQSNPASGRLVTGEQRLVHSFRRVPQPFGAGRLRIVPSTALNDNSVKGVASDHVAARYELCSQATGANPSVGSLIVDAQLCRSSSKVDEAIAGFAHLETLGRLQQIRLLSTKSN